MAGSVEVAPDLTKVSLKLAPSLAENVAPDAEEGARPNPALNSVAASASPVYRWTMTRLVGDEPDDLLVGAEETWGGDRGGKGCRGPGAGGRRGGWGGGGGRGDCIGGRGGGREEGGGSKGVVGADGADGTGSSRAEGAL